MRRVSWFPLLNNGEDGDAYYHNEDAADPNQSNRHDWFLSRLVRCAGSARYRDFKGNAPSSHSGTREHIGGNGRFPDAGCTMLRPPPTARRLESHHFKLTFQTFTFHLQPEIPSSSSGADAAN